MEPCDDQGAWLAAAVEGGEKGAAVGEAASGSMHAFLHQQCCLASCNSTWAGYRGRSLLILLVWPVLLQGTCAGVC